MQVVNPHPRALLPWKIPQRESFSFGKDESGQRAQNSGHKLDAGLLTHGLKLFKILESSSQDLSLCLNAATGSCVILVKSLSLSELQYLFLSSDFN